MKSFTFIELPKEEVVKKSDLSFLEGATDCTDYTACSDTKGGKSNCGSYTTNPCACGGSLYCKQYSF